jgi:chromosome segregation ATPase
VDQAQKRREEIAALQEQLSGLQRKLHEKDEALRSAENLIGRITAANEAVDGLRSQLSEKELLIESTGSELHGAKVNLDLVNTFCSALHSLNILFSL